jgi:hypothetical protein
VVQAAEHWNLHDDPRGIWGRRRPARNLLTDALVRPCVVEVGAVAPEDVPDYGAVVDQGAVLAQIDDTLYRAQLDQARANVGRARADLLAFQAKLRKAECDWKRAQELRRTGVISDADYDLAAHAAFLPFALPRAVTTPHRKAPPSSRR